MRSQTAANDPLGLSCGLCLFLSLIEDTHSTAGCVLMEGITHLRLPTPHHQPHPLLPAPPLIHTTCDITAAVKKVSQNPAVLAS